MSPEIKCGDLMLKLDLGQPSETAQKKALQELRETPENIRNGLKELNRLLKDETDLNIPKTNEEWLTKFLRACKFYPESAKDLIRRYYNIRRKYTEITKDLTPLKLKHVFEANLVTMLPQRDQDGRRIVVTVLAGKPWNYKVIPHENVYAGSTLCTVRLIVIATFLKECSVLSLSRKRQEHHPKTLSMVGMIGSADLLKDRAHSMNRYSTELIQLETETQINGVVYIVDLGDLTIGQALQITPYRMKRVLDYIQNNIPLRVKGLHIVNQPKIFEPIFATVKLFFNKKFNERIMLHGTNYASLHRYISPECLPECYGGSLKMKLMYGPETYELLSHYQEYLEELEQYGFKKD